jgi:uncharacterized membrane protein YeiH
MTACFGGVIRDILCNEIPVILEKKFMLPFAYLAVLFFYAQKIATERRCFVSQYITGYNFLFV